MRKHYDQSEYTQPGSEFSLPPEESSTLGGGRRFPDDPGRYERTLADPDDPDTQAAEDMSAASEESASTAEQDAAQTAAKKTKRRNSLLLQFAAAASSLVLVTSSFGIDLLGLDGLFNDSVIFGEERQEPSEPEPERSGFDFAELLPFGADTAFPAPAEDTVTQREVTNPHDRFIATAKFGVGTMGESAYVGGFVYVDPDHGQSLYAPVAMTYNDPDKSMINDASIRYDASSNTLTLSRYHGAGLLINNMGPDFTIELVGDNILEEYLLVGNGSVKLTGDGGIVINQNSRYPYGIELAGGWSEARLMIDARVKFDITGDLSVFHANATCAEKPFVYLTPHTWAECYQGRLPQENISPVKTDANHYYDWLLTGSKGTELIVNINNSYRPDVSPYPSETEPAPTAEVPAGSVRLPIGGDSSFPMLPNPMPGSVGGDGVHHESSILVWEASENGMPSDALDIYSYEQNHPTGRSDIFYDPASNVLTLNNYTGERLDLRNMGSSFKIRLIGRNELLEGIIILGDLTSGSVTFTGDGYLGLNTSHERPAGINLDAGEAAACIMIESSVSMDIYGKNTAVTVGNTTADKAIYYLSDQALPGLMQKSDAGEKGTTLGGTVYDWTITGENGRPAPHIHIGGEAPPVTQAETEAPDEMNLPVGGDSAFPVLPNPDPNTPVGYYGFLDENYIQVYDRTSGASAYLYAHRNSDLPLVPQAGLSYDEDTNTLTMNNYRGNALIVNMMGNKFTVELIGENVLTQDFLIWGFYTAGSVRFTGSGSLTINSSRASEVGLYLECEFSESCVMIEEDVTLDIYGSQYALLINNSFADKGVYLLSPAPRPGVRQTVIEQRMPDINMEGVPQLPHKTWTLTGSDTGNTLTRFRVEGTGLSR